MMKKGSAVGLLLLTIILFSCGDIPNGKYNFNDGWKFKLLNDSNSLSSDYLFHDYDDTDWESVSLPHTAHLEPLIVNDQWQGDCWYRKTFKVPKTYKGKKIFLELEAAMNTSKIWINGVNASDHNGGYLPVVLDISKLVNVGKENVIAISLNNTDNAVTGPKPLKILDFNMYGGLYRNAWLSVKDQVYISHPVLANKVAGGGVFITTPKVSKDKSVVNIKTHVLNENQKSQIVEVVHNLLFNGSVVVMQNSERKELAANSEFEFVDEFVVENANLWSPNSPSLYQMETEIWVDGKVLDRQVNDFGIRLFEFRNNDLFVNGEKTFLRGVNRHQEYPFIGYALSDNAQYRDAKKIKEAGFNFIRLSHYPQSPAFMRACDELGLMVFDAILGWQYYADNDDFRNYCYKSAKELIYRDRNHPSVLAWEVSLNETQMPVFFMEKLHEIVHTQYPGENVYSCGWMDEVYDIYLQARQHRILHPNSSIEKPYFVSEYGDWEYYSSNAGLNQHEYSKEMRYEKSSRQKRGYGEERLLQQAYNVQEAHNDNLYTPAFGDAYWVMYDYNRGYHDDIEYSGLMDIFRLPKFSYYFFKSQQSLKQDTVVHLATWWTKESPLDIRVYSNCDEVALYLNNKLVSKQKPDTDSNSTNLYHPPFTFKLDEFIPGTLKAVGLVDGQAISEHVVSTPGNASKLKIWIDESDRSAQAGCNDVLFLYIAVVDENGIIVPDFYEKVDVVLDGNIELMNTEDLNFEAGIATALIRVGDLDGVFKVSAQSGNSLHGVTNIKVNSK